MAGDDFGSLESACIGAADQPAEAGRPQRDRDRRCLEPAGLGELWVTDSGITPGCRKDAIEFGLSMTDQDHPNPRTAIELPKWGGETTRGSSKAFTSPAPVVLVAAISAPHLNRVDVRAGSRRSQDGGRPWKAMGEFQQYFDIILFAMVAGFLVLRLRSVLGRRTGNERRRELFPRSAAPASDNVTTLIEPDKRPARPADDALPADVVAEGLNRIRRSDSSFDP